MSIDTEVIGINKVLVVADDSIVRTMLRNIIANLFSPEQEIEHFGAEPNSSFSTVDWYDPDVVVVVSGHDRGDQLARSRVLAIKEKISRSKRPERKVILIAKEYWDSLETGEGTLAERQESFRARLREKFLKD